MTRNVSTDLFGSHWVLLAVGLSLWLSQVATAQTAKDFYLSNVETIVQGECIVCHRSGGNADSNGADILFTSSASGNHDAFDAYVNSPTLGAKSGRVLSKIIGGAGHGGGAVISQGSPDYEAFSAYMDLLTEDEPTVTVVHRVALEEPVAGEIHTGVGNLRGWAVATDGISKVEIFIDGAYEFDAPYGGRRNDVGGAFPDVEGSSDSGFSLAWNYSDLSAGPHTITAVAHTATGATQESSASFNVVKFDTFIAAENAVDLNEGSCSLSSDEISILDARVEGSLYDLVLKWRTAEQGFEIIEIR